MDISRFHKLKIENDQKFWITVCRAEISRSQVTELISTKFQVGE